MPPADPPALSLRDRAAAALEAQIAEGRRIDHASIPTPAAFHTASARYRAWHQQNRLLLAELFGEGSASERYERVPSAVVMQNWTLSDPLGAAIVALRTEVHARVKNLEALLADLVLAPSDDAPPPRE